MIKHLWKVRMHLAAHGTHSIEEIYVVTGSTFCGTALSEMSKYSEATYKPSKDDSAEWPCPLEMFMDPIYVGEVWVEE